MFQYKFCAQNFIKRKSDKVIQWKDQVEDGKRKVKCVGSGNERDLRKKSERESLSEVGNCNSIRNLV